MEDTSVKPIIEVPAGDPPSELMMEDLVVGDGAEAAAGAIVNVDYVGVSWSTGAEFDASWNRGDVFSFALGGGMVIQGWDQGVLTMKIGESARITCTPDFGYGAGGFPAWGIMPNSTLAFEIEVLSEK